MRWLEPTSYHVTLKFLGSVDSSALPGIRTAVDEAVRSNAPFDLQVTGVGAFPTIRKPRVLWVGVDPSPSLRCLKQDLEWAMSGQGFERETRAFHPHITVGRALDDQGAGAFRGLDDDAAALDIGLSAPVRTVDLTRSHLSRAGARYEVLHQGRLGTD